MAVSPLPPNPNEGIDYPRKNLRAITLAGGCFWGTQAYLSRLRGVDRTQCGYANGHTEQPSYEAVCRGDTGHAEAVRLLYDYTVLPLDTLLDEFFKTINPTSLNRQGGDVGSQYRTGIYCESDEDLESAHRAVARVQQRCERPVVTEVCPLVYFYPAEDYHQDYLEKNPGGYCHVDLGKLPTQ